VELRYNIAYHLRCQLALRSGRTVTLEALDQRMTYAGLLEGTPDAKSNEWHIKHALREASRHCVLGAKPYLIPPSRRDYRREPGDMQGIIERSPHRTPEWLPMVQCIGSFYDVVKARNPARDLSVLVVVWFQDGYALPILEPALSHLLTIDWESLAIDIDI
jgi:hypothetical protein